MRAGLEAWARDRGATLALEDDRSDPALAARLHAQLRDRCRVVLGPYGSDSTRAVARARAAPSGTTARPPTTSSAFPGWRRCPRPRAGTSSRSAVRSRPCGPARAPPLRPLPAASPVSPARASSARRRRSGWNWSRSRPTRMPFSSAARSSGSSSASARCRRTKLLGGVSPGLTAIAERLDPEGLLAPVQWHPDLGGPPGLEDYVAAQAYAAAADRRALPELPTDALGLETETFFGALPARSRRAPGRARAVRRPVARRPSGLVLTGASSLV